MKVKFFYVITKIWLSLIICMSVMSCKSHSSKENGYKVTNKTKFCQQLCNFPNTFVVHWFAHWWRTI